jgi:hypothetical protein
MVQPSERHRKETRDLAMAIILAAASIGLTIFLKITLAGWVLFIGWFAFAGYIGNLERMVGVKKVKRRAIQAAIIVLGTGLEIVVLYPFWREEQAAVLEGDLRGAGEIFNDGKERVAPWVEIADSGSVSIMLPRKAGEPAQPYYKPFPDAEFRTEYGKKGPMVSTTIRDGDGHIVATVEKNHWTVYQPFCPDKNYTEDALEILDSSWHVVLQLRILTDRVQVQGEWWDNQGNGLRVVKGSDGHAYAAPLGPRIKRNELLIRPMFVHPSKHHWEEFVR